MRTIGRMLLFVLISLLLLVLGLNYLPAITSLFSSEQEWQDQYYRNTVYWLETDRTLRFNIPANSEQIRILFSSISLAGEQSVESEIEWTLLGSETEIHQRTIAFRASSDELIASNTQPELPTRFYDDPNGNQSTSSEVVIINNAKQTPFTGIHFKQRSGIYPVAIRVSILEKRNDDAVDLVWRRINEEQQSRLVADHIYPPSLIDVKERRAALRYEWKPIGPLGFAGQDYQTGELYLHQLWYNQSARGVSDPIDYHRVVQLDRWFTFFTQTGDGYHSLSCIPTTENPLKWLMVQWQPQGEFEIQEWRVPVDDILQYWALPEGNGLVQIQASAPCEVTVFDKDKLEIPVETPKRTGFIVSPEQYVDYPLISDSSEQQPIRLDARRLIRYPFNERLELPKINWTIRDKSDQVLQHGVLLLNDVIDPYESLPVDQQKEKLFAKSRLFITASKDAHVLRISTNDETALVNVYTRPLYLPYARVVSDANSVNRNELPLRWFQIQPIEPTNQSLVKRSMTWNFRPRFQTLDEMDWQKDWQAIPADQQGAFDAFVYEQHEASDSGTVFRFVRLDDKKHSETTNSTRQKTKHYEIQIRDANARSQVEPTLVFHRQDNQPQQITLRIDQSEPVTRWIIGKAGRVNLPMLSIGNHHLSIKGPNHTQWFMNFLPHDNELIGRVRPVVELEGSVDFFVDKQTTSEWLTFQYFPQTTQPHQIRIELIHEYSVGQRLAHTIPIKTFTISPPSTPRSVDLLNEPTEALFPARLLIVPLREDLPPNTYRLRVSSSLNQSGYIQAGFVQNELGEKAIRYSEVEDAQ